MDLTLWINYSFKNTPQDCNKNVWILHMELKPIKSVSLSEYMSYTCALKIHGNTVNHGGYEGVSTLMACGYCKPVAGYR